MHHFVMRQRQHEIFREGIEQPEGQVILVMAPVNGIARHILQRVMHEAHVPLETEAESAAMDGLRNAGECRGLFGDCDDAGMRAVAHLIHPLEESDGLKIFVAAVFIWNPLAALARVVEIEHRGHRIDAKPVDVILLQPEQGIVDQETLHLGAAKIINGRVPVRMKPLARVRMLVKCGAVKMRQAEFIRREMRWNPINDDADARRVGRIHKAGKPFRVAKARSRRKKSGRLIAPRGIIGVLGDGQQFDMGEPHGPRIIHKVACQFIVA